MRSTNKVQYYRHLELYHLVHIGLLGHPSLPTHKCFHKNVLHCLSVSSDDNIL